MLSANVLRRFIPLSDLPSDARLDLARAAQVRAFRRGELVFERGDAGREVAYLLAGEVDLHDGGRRARRIRASTEEARHALCASAFRATTARCVRDASIAWIDRDRLDLAITWAQSGEIDVVELAQQVDDAHASAGDWMTGLLENPAFHRIPPANIPRIFAALEPLELAPGETVVHEGAAGDAWFVVARGRVEVRRAGNPIVALGPGRCFGEEALVSGEPRGASVVALTPLTVMRLPASAFAELLVAPLLRTVAPEAVSDAAQLVDVRLPAEFERGRLPGAINLPLAKLRTEAAKLASDREYVVYCDSGRRSAAATYLLSERGFDARLLKGGIPADEMPVRG